MNRKKKRPPLFENNNRDDHNHNDQDQQQVNEDAAENKFFEIVKENGQIDKCLIDEFLANLDEYLYGKSNSSNKLPSPDELVAANHNLSYVNGVLERDLKARRKSKRNHHQHQKRRTICSVLCTHWDIVLLIALNALFLAYIFMFVSSYYVQNETTMASRQVLKFIDRKAVDIYIWLVEKWMLFNDFDDLSKEECALIVPDHLNSILRPLDDCAMCEGLSRIERLENITKEQFLADYAYTAVPVIVKNSLNEWPAMKILNFKFLKDLYLHPNKIKKKYKFLLKSNNRQNKNKETTTDEADEQTSQLLAAVPAEKNSFIKAFSSFARKRQPSPSLPLNGGRNADGKITCQFFPYKTKFRSLEQVFAMSENDQQFNKSWYVGWSNCNDFASSVLRELYDRPPFLPDDSEMSKIDWIFMGTPGYGAQIHIDDVINPSWQAQISGIKQWTFKPPAECFFRCKTLYIDVYPGEIIIFDSNRWFHATTIIGNELSLTIGSEYD